VFEITPEEKAHRCDIGASRWSQNKTIPSDPTTREPAVESFSYDRVVGPFMFVENTITGDSYFDMLEHYVFPQIDNTEREKGISVIFQQDGAPPHYSLIV
jgi:hypothetical protein